MDLSSWYLVKPLDSRIALMSCTMVCFPAARDLGCCISVPGCACEVQDLQAPIIK